MREPESWTTTDCARSIVIARMYIKLADDVLGNRLTLHPAHLDGVAIVDPAVDAREAEERLEIIEMARGDCRRADVRPAPGPLTGQGHRWNVGAIEVLEHRHDGSRLDGMIRRVFRVWWRRNQRQPGRILQLRKADRRGILDRRPRAPEMVGELSLKRRVEGVRERETEHRERARIVFNV
jgi:hypothetical protein